MSRHAAAGVAGPSHETIDIDLGLHELADQSDPVEGVELPEIKISTTKGKTDEIQVKDKGESIGSIGVRAASDSAHSGPTNGWTQQIEIYVSSISMKCKAYRDIHEASTIYYDKRNSYFTIFLIFVSFMVSAISLIPFFTGEVFKYVIALLSVFTTTLTTVNKFLRYQESVTKHRLASQRFLELHRDITEQFLLPFPDRINGKEYLTTVGRSFDSVIKTAPFPPEEVKTKKKISSTPDSDINFASNFPPPELPTTASSSSVHGNPFTSIPSSSAEQQDDSAKPPNTLQVPYSAPIQSVNPEAGASTDGTTRGYAISRMARYQLQRARGDLDSFAADYD